ncbi:MAG: hypothetical protein Phog2KO_35810 [Phototrophicaceae bacterium]
MSKIVIPNTSDIYSTFDTMSKQAKVIILTGLPGVGKSLYVQQLALMAQRAGRKVHLMQWDVTRSAFETPDILAKYPEIDGVTHAMIRKAVGIWTRQAILDWADNFSSEEHLLIGEATFVGERLMQLAKIVDDSAEGLLSSEKTQFILPVPSKAVRANIETKRAESIANPQHQHESKDAPPNVLEMLWHEIHHVGYKIGITDTAQAQPAYQPEVYQQTYEYLLQHRHSTTLNIGELFERVGSVYDLDNIAGHLKASPEQVTTIIAQLEQSATVEQTQAEVDVWYRF